MNDLIADYGRDPAYYGRLENPDIRHEEKNLSCAEEITVDICFDENNRVAEIAFEAEGRPVMLATMSLLCERLDGEDLKIVEEMTKADILKILEIDELSEKRMQSALLGLLALKNIYRFRQGKKSLDIYDLL